VAQTRAGFRRRRDYLETLTSNNRCQQSRRRLLAATSVQGRVSRVSPVQTATRNCMRDEGRPFGVGNQVPISSHRKLPLSKAMVVSVAESPGHDSGRHG
jgi:hypothetical protein